MGLIPGSGRSPGGGHGNPLQYSCLENPMDRAAWRIIVHRVPKSHPRPKQLSRHMHATTCINEAYTLVFLMAFILESPVFLTAGQVQ